MEAWPGQKHLQASLDSLKDEFEERERVGETEIKRDAQKDEIGTLWNLFPSPSVGKRQMTSGLFSSILGSRNEAKLKGKILSMLMAEAEAEEMSDRIGRTSFSKILSPTCIHGKLQLNQEQLDELDSKGNFPQMLARPRKRESELLLGEVGPGRGLFSNILSRLDGRREDERLDGRQRRALKRAQGIKSLFTHILRWSRLEILANCST